MRFNEKLLILRAKNNLSQEELADKLNVTRQTVSKWETGNSYTDMGKLVEMCKIFDCKLQDLLDDGTLSSNKTIVNKMTIVLSIITLLCLIAVSLLSVKLYRFSNEHKLLSFELSLNSNLNNLLTTAAKSTQSKYLGTNKSGFETIELINSINENNKYLKENNIDPANDSDRWCIYINSDIEAEYMLMDPDELYTNHKKLKFYVEGDDETNYPYTQYDSSVIDPLKYYTIGINNKVFYDTNKLTNINIVEVIDPNETMISY